MDDYLLDNYELSYSKMFQSLIYSEYGIRHLIKAKECHSVWHRFIATIELFPLIGLIATIIEAIAIKIINLFITPTKILFKGSQGGCNGYVNQKEVNKIIVSLQSSKEPFINFNEKKVVGEIYGGTCTAMSLTFVKKFLKAKNNVEVIKDKFRASNEKLRNIQAAFNTIEIIRSNDVVDYSKNKIQSLANYYKLKINNSSKELDINKIESEGENEFNNEINKLQLGIYVIRALKPSTNEKLEEYGHTMIYIKTTKINLLYDPNYGIEILRRRSKHCSMLLSKLKRCNYGFQTNKVKFYQLLEPVPGT